MTTLRIGKSVDNQTLEDLIAESTENLTPSVIEDGSVSEPGLRFTNDTDTGIYRIASDNFGISCGGTGLFDLNATRLMLNTDLCLPAESKIENASLGESIVFNDAGTAVYFTASGTERLRIDSTKIQSERPIWMTNNGDVSNPQYSFNNDTNTGMYLIGTDNLGITCNGIKQIDISTSNVSFENNITLNSGFDSNPSINFINSSSSGLDYQKLPSENWTDATIPAGNNTDWEYVIWNETEDIVIATGDANVGDSYEYIVRSTDGGVTWSNASSINGLAPAVFNARVIAYSSVLGRFVLLGETRDSLYSDDAGDNWSVSNNGMPEDLDWRGLAYSPSLDLFSAVADSGTIQIATSSDGISWTSRSKPSARSWQEIVWDDTNNLFISYNNSANINESVMTSPDGINWTHRSVPAGISLSAMAYSSNLGFTILFSNSTTAYKSTDGINWTSINVGNIGSIIHAIWTGQMFFCAGINGNYMYSYDGDNWTTGLHGIVDYFGCAYSNTYKKFIMVGKNSPALSYTEDIQSVNLISNGSKSLSANSEYVKSHLPFTLESYASGSYPAGSPVGTIIYSTTLGRILYYNGASWLTIDGEISVS